MRYSIDTANTTANNPKLSQSFWRILYKNTIYSLLQMLFSDRWTEKPPERDSFTRVARSISTISKKNKTLRYRKTFQVIVWYVANHGHLSRTCPHERRHIHNKLSFLRRKKEKSSYHKNQSLKMSRINLFIDNSQIKLRSRSSYFNYISHISIADLCSYFSIKFDIIFESELFIYFIPATMGR